MRAFHVVLGKKLRHLSVNARYATSLVEVSVVDRIGLITLNDPARLNALTVDMGDAFVVAVDQMTAAAKQQQVRAVVVTGKGDAFSAGGDLNWLTARHTSTPFLNSSIMVDFYNRFLSVRKIPVPTICAINGSAIGAGMCMTLACDMRIAATNAKIGFTFSKLGIHPG
jgi:enoyl-CoA hydratase/carnithine racemase